MAKNSLVRWIRAIFDRDSAKVVEKQLGDSLGAAGKKGGENFVRELRAAFDKKMADLKVKLASGLIDPKEFKKQADLAAKAFNTGIINGMTEARKAGTLTDAVYLKLSRTLKKVGDEGATVAATVGGRMQGAFLKAGTAIAGFFAFHKITAFLADSIHASIETEDSVVRLTGVLKPLGIAYDSVAGEVETYLDTLQKTTRFSTADGREALVNLIVATGDYRKSLSLMDVTAKIAEKRHTTMAVAAQAAADASKGVTRGMKDLGIIAGDTGDLVAKINTALGELAIDGGQTKGGRLAITKNLLGEVKTAFGDAILGGTGFANSTRDIQGALIDLADWIKTNRDTISDFSSLLVGMARIVATLSKIGMFPPRQLLSVGRRILGQTPQEREAEAKAAIAQDEALAIARAKALETFDRLHPRTKPGRDREPTKEELDAIEKARRDEEARAKRIADELQRITDDTAVHRLMAEQDLTEALAREMVRRAKMLKDATAAEAVALREGWKQGATAALLAKALEEGPSGKAKLTPGVGIGIPGTQELRAGPDIIPAATKQAKKFESVWVRALDAIRNETTEAGTLFRELGEAWAEGGIAGLARLAMAKVKENLAWAIEEGAKALGALAYGNVAAASLHGKAAVDHGIAAAAWGVASQAFGGGGGGGGGSGFGSTTPNLAGPQRAEPPKQEVTIVLSGPGFHAMNPKVQSVVWGAQQMARERFGQNAVVRIKREG